MPLFDWIAVFAIATVPFAILEGIATRQLRLPFCRWGATLSRRAHFRSISTAQNGQRELGTVRYRVVDPRLVVLASIARPFELAFLKAELRRADTSWYLILRLPIMTSAFFTAVAVCITLSGFNMSRVDPAGWIALPIGWGAIAAYCAIEYFRASRRLAAASMLIAQDLGWTPISGVAGRARAGHGA